MSGVSNDLAAVRAAAEAGDPRAEIAQQVFAYAVRKCIGAYLAALGRADAIVFAGGIGEGSDDMRRRILEGLDALGIVLDRDRNAACGGREGTISAPRSAIRLLVIPTDEELLIARETERVVRDAGGSVPEAPG
jgi:acetate kinase